MSPTPLARENDPTGKLLIGTIVRAITFTLLFRANGITGWKLKLSADRASRSPPELKLNCSGTETRFDTGFWVCFANSFTSGGGSWARADVAAARHTRPTGMSSGVERISLNEAIRLPRYDRGRIR